MLRRLGRRGQVQSHFRVREAVQVPPTSGLPGKPGGSV